MPKFRIPRLSRRDTVPENTMSFPPPPGPFTHAVRASEYARVIGGEQRTADVVSARGPIAAGRRPGDARQTHTALS